MGKRKHSLSEGRNSFGGEYVKAGMELIDKYQERTVQTMTVYEPTTWDMVNELFPADAIRYARDAKEVVIEDALRRVVAYPLGDDVQLTINYGALPVLPVLPLRRELLYRVPAFMEFVEQVRDIHRKFEDVKHVLRWCNENASAAAARALWPTLLQVLPASCPVLKDLQGMPARYQEPKVAWKMTEIMRSTAVTMAAAKMLPVGVDIEVGSRYLTFSSYRSQTYPNYATNYRTYYF
jgi:hypothetical protein